MNKYKVCVYGICKNEEKFVKRWYESMKEADAIFVLDTGSTDNTVKLLKEFGVNVRTSKIEPWRFDVARNKSLDLIPDDYDICVCTDLDEVFEKGWRKYLEDSWVGSTSRARYNYNWSLDDNNRPLVNFYIDKIHQRKNYKWTHPVHEVLTFLGDKENIITIDNIVLNHYPDKSKSRSSYLPLLELSVKEDPNDDRNMHYLGREYMYYGKWNEAIDTLIKHLSLKTATWNDERCASMRFISRCYRHLNRYEEARMWLDKAIKEAPYLRDPYMERALLEYDLENYEEVKKYCLLALKIKNHPKTYINEIFSWNNTVYDLLAISSYYLNELDKAIEYEKLALTMEPDNERLKSNLEKLEKYIENPNPDNVLVLVCDNLDKRKKLVTTLLKKAELTEEITNIHTLIKKRLEDYQMSSNTEKMLLEYCMNDYERVFHELDKLKLYKMEDKVITEKDIEAIVMKSMDDNIFI